MINLTNPCASLWKIGISADVVFERLLKFGLFPERLSKILSSEQLGKYKNIKSDILSPNCSCQPKHGCDLLIYRQYKSNNIERALEIPNPIAYINASLCIKNNWDNHIQKHLNKVDITKISMITISEFNETGRLFKFEDYSGEIQIEQEAGRLLSLKTNNQDKRSETNIINKLSLNSSYLVIADISQCYPSIYTHSIAWVAVGIDVAKQNIGNNNIWYNQLDKNIMKMQRHETAGISIGSDVSAIVAEIVLAQIDYELKDFNYIRHVDDYKCYCKTREEAEHFIETLSRTLHKYKMKLNDKKTMIMELPQPTTEKYIRRLREISNTLENKINSRNINNWLLYVDEAVEYSKSIEDSHALRYLFSTISKSKVEEDNSTVFNVIFERLLGLCYHYYSLLEKLVSFIENNSDCLSDSAKVCMKTFIEGVIEKYSFAQKSEALVWAFYLAIKYNLEIEFEDDKLISSEDYLPIMMGYLYRFMQNENTNKYEKIVNENHAFAWLFNYQFCFFENKNAKCLEKLREDKISFLDSEFESILLENRLLNNNYCPF